jgi:hypothetical protein
VQEVRWDTGNSVRAGDIFFYKKKKTQNHQLGKGFFVHHTILSAVKRVEIVSDRKWYIIL